MATDQVETFLTQVPLVSDDETSCLKGALNIARILRADQCCYRCVLRFLGCTSFYLYAYEDKELSIAFNQVSQKYCVEGLAELNEEFICTACIGAIQHADSFVDDVYKRLKAEEYETIDVCMSCTMPIGMLTRDTLLRFHANEILKQQGQEAIINEWKEIAVRDPKDFFKYLFGLKWKEVTGLGEIKGEAPLRMTVVINHEPSAKEHMFLSQVKEPTLRVRTIRQKKVKVVVGDSRWCITEALKKVDPTEARELTAIPPQPSTSRATFESVTFLHESSYVGGRYLKYSREYSQTPWTVRGKKLAEYAVSDCFQPLLEKYHRADSSKFCTAGREDANVRMLGSGRPFYLELVNPRKPRLSDEEYKQIQEEVNSSEIHKDAVQVKRLCHIKPADRMIIKQGEETKTKLYRALVWLSEPLTDELIAHINHTGSTPFTINQKTPVRVFQRRSAAIRPKVIHTSTIERLSDKPEDAHLGVLQLHTQAGTYIKEYVHGDLGRTLPNLASVGGIHSADLLELDVMNVDLDFPIQHNNEE